MLTIEEMRAHLGLGPEVSDAAVVEAYIAAAGLGGYVAPAAVVDVPLDPFAMALDAQFYAPGSAAAIFTPAGGQPLPEPIRVIRSQPDDEANFGNGSVIQETNAFSIRRSDVAEPRKNDTLLVAADAFRLKGEAMLDVEGLTWTIGAVPA